MIRFNLKLAFRNITKNKVYSFLIIGGFAIGFAAVVLIILYYYTERNVNKNFTNHRYIYRLYDAKKNKYNLNYNLFPILVENYPEIKDACPMEYGTGFEITLKNDQTNENTRIKHLINTTNNFFSIFSVRIVSSLSDKPFAEKESFVLTEKVAKAVFGSQNPLGQRVSINGSISGNVTAIISDLPVNSTFKAEVLINSDNEKFRFSKTCNKGVCYHHTNFYLLVKDGTNLDGFISKLNNTINSYDMDVDSVGMQNLADFYLSSLNMKSNHMKGNPKLLKVFLTIAALIILLSSINYLNYSLTMQYAKLQEMGIYKSYGANWQHLLNYSFIEVSLGILISVVISILVTLMILPYSESLFGKALVITFQDLIVLVPVFIATVMAVIVINSLASIFIVSRFKIAEFLSGFSGKRNHKQIGTQAMLIFQLTASIVLIAAVILIFKQLNFVKYSDLGFDKEVLVRINLPQKFQQAEVFKIESEKIPSVKSTTLAMDAPE